MNKERVVVGTRYFETNSAKAAQSRDRLVQFILAALAAGAERVLVAVDPVQDRSEVLQISTALPDFPADRVTIFPVTPWGKFVAPLNAILMTARPVLAEGALLLLASVEVSLTRGIISALLRPMDDSVLVVGGAVEGHLHVRLATSGPTGRYATGQTVPWNTLALWNPAHLWLTGFPLIGDGVLAEPGTAGVEELATIAILQSAYRERTPVPLYGQPQALLVQVPGVTWDTSHFDGARQEAHRKKMESKCDRPARQLEALGLQSPIVYHV